MARPSCFLLLAAAAAALCLTAGACVPRERDALLAFKAGITDDPAGRLATWRRGSDCCRWRGVQCSNRTGHVLALRLRPPPRGPCRGLFADEDQELSYSLEFQDPDVADGDGDLSDCRKGAALVGNVSSSLLSLEHLEHLDLSFNSLSSEPKYRFPGFLGSLKRLRYLNLACIPFQDTLPPQLGNLSDLHHLDISYCEAFPASSDLSWLTRLQSLRYLDLSGADLSKASDHWAGVVNTIPSLRALHLSRCQLESADQPLQHINLTKLERLDLSANTLNHTFESCWFWGIRSLKYLNLQATYLYGQVPHGLAAMTSLQVFQFFTGNNFYPPASTMEPSLLRNLSNLEILSITESLSSGNITEMLESLLQCASSTLRELDLGGNNLSGTLPAKMGQFTNLAILDLSHNQLTGTLPTSMGQLTNLVILDLSPLDDEFTGPNSLHGVVTEEHFAFLQSLKYIDLSGNYLNIVLDPEWLPPFRLKWANFHSCQLGPKFPSWLQWSVDIRELVISNTSITDPFPNWFSAAFSKATSLDISNNRISGGLPTNMEIMSLKALLLSSNQITGLIPMLPRNLTWLDISRNYLSGPFPPKFGAPNLEHIFLSYNNLSCHIPGSICELQNLMVLHLANNFFEGEFPDCFLMKEMSTLVLSNNSFSGMFPSFLHSCTQLNLLDLSHNKFFGRLPVWIGDFKELQYLQLSYNFFHGNVPFSITNLGELYNLNLAGNMLSGIIPTHLSNLTAMTTGTAKSSLDWNSYAKEFPSPVVTKRQELYYSFNLPDMVSIDLSLNCLTGGIPEEVASLALLKNLNLSFNFLSGKIPDKIGSIKSLESLDLSRNKLSQGIPVSLSNLTSLSYLDLSHNNLSGRIPSGSQLDSLYANHPFMYSGNEGLCGPPLQTNCSVANASKQHDEYDVGHRRTAGHAPILMFYFHLGLGSGFVVGLWVVFCAMLFNKIWRIAYFCLLDKMYDEMYVFVGVSWARLA